MISNLGAKVIRPRETSHVRGAGCIKTRDNVPNLFHDPSVLIGSEQTDLSFPLA